MAVDENWRSKAACRGANQAIFFPERGGDAWTAFRICATCPVRVECLDYAIDNPDVVGIWGGMSDRKRTLLRRQPRPKPDSPCGTNNGYQRHMRIGTTPCGPCRMAHAVRRRQDRASA